MLIRIDDKSYTIKCTDAPNITEAQRDLLKLLCAISSLSNAFNVRGELLAELMGLKVKAAYESRLSHLVEKGCIELRESPIENLESLVTY